MEIDMQQFIKERLDEIDLKSLVVEEVRLLIYKEVLSEIKSAVKSKVDTMIKEEIDLIMKSTPIKTDDGWGTREEFPCFADLFKKVLYDRLESGCDMKRMIQKTVLARVDALMKEHATAAIKKVADELCNIKAAELVE